MNYSLSMKLLYMATIFFQHYNNSYTHQNIILVSLALLLVISAVLERNKIMRNVKKKKKPNSYIIINLLLGNNPARFRSNLCIFSVAWWSSWLLENFREFAEKHKTRCKFSLLHLNSKQKETHDFHTNFSLTTLVWTFNAMVKLTIRN